MLFHLNKNSRRFFIFEIKAKGDHLMHIVFCGDKNIVKPVSVVIASIDRLCEKNREVRVSIVGVGWEHADVDYIKKHVMNVSIEYVSADNIQLPVVRNGRHLTSAAYLTLFLPQIFPHESKILYLDHDVLVRDRRIFDGWNMSMNSMPLAAVASAGNIPFIGGKNGIVNWRELRLNPKARMFNSGVILYDLDRCRAMELTERSVKYAQEEGYRSRLADQHALNVVLNGSWTGMPLIYNVPIKAMDDAGGAYALWDVEEADDARSNPCIVHFLGRTKPWHYNCNLSFVDEWRVLSAAQDWYPWKNKPKMYTILMKYVSMLFQKVVRGMTKLRKQIASNK
jgi:lipopolysaccharide biosynthesis glycosyltransferase